MMFDVKGETYEEQTNYDDKLKMYKNTGVLSNHTEVMLTLSNKPTESIWGYPIRDVHMVSSEFQYYVSGSNGAFDGHKCSVFLYVLKNLAQVGFSYAYLTGWVPPAIAPDSQTYTFTEELFTEGVVVDYIFCNVTTNTTSTTYAYIISFYMYTTWGYNIYGNGVSLFIDKIVYFIPIFLLIFIVPISLYEAFGKMGFIISIILMTILSIMSSMLDISMGIVVILCEITILVIIYKKEAKNY